MRMWMVNPSIMCRQHLLGEHCELHMFVGTLNKHKHMKGYIEHNCLEYSSIHKRHMELVNEMAKRGFIHKSELPLLDNYYFENDKDVYLSKVDKDKALQDLLSRCEKCKQRFEIET